MPHPVLVTGIGLITPFGFSREESWRGILSGHSATRWLTGEMWESFPGGVVGAPLPEMPPPETSREPVVDLAVRAAAEAIEDAGIDLRVTPRDRVGCVIGTSKGGLRSFAPDSWELFLPSAAAAGVARTFDLRGPLLAPVAACATGLVSLIRGFELVRDGFCDVVFAGGSDASLLPIVLSSFRRLGVLARVACRPCARRGSPDPAETADRRSPFASSGRPSVGSVSRSGDRDTALVRGDAAAACRPFDRHRSGFVVGEGAAVLVLESESSAAARDAVPYARWLAGRVLSDACGLTQLDESGLGLARLIGEVLGEAELAPEQIDYVNVHGTATRQNDLCETRALKAALEAAAREVSCSSLKGAIGHLLGAAGSVETAASLLALRDGVIPPTVNLTEPDPECDLDYTPGQARRRELTCTLKLSTGFGGHLAAAVLRKDGGRNRLRRNILLQGGSRRERNP